MQYVKTMSIQRLKVQVLQVKDCIRQMAGVWDVAWHVWMKEYFVEIPTRYWRTQPVVAERNSRVMLHCRTAKPSIEEGKLACIDECIQAVDRLCTQINPVSTKQVDAGCEPSSEISKAETVRRR